MACARLALLLVTGCDPGTPAPSSSCPDVQPSACPTPIPSFAAEVNGIIQQRCSTCHNPAGPNPDRVFTSYARIYAQRSAILDQTVACRMPPAGAPALTGPERVALVDWLACRAPEN